jgi:type IX secretion system PorP/SprF family membrane protein
LAKSPKISIIRTFKLKPCQCFTSKNILKMKKILLLFIYIAVYQGVSAQQYPLFTNYITNCFGFNPATAATSKCVQANISHRQQWVGVAESPQTSILSLHSRAGKKVGVGGYIFNDQAGSLRRTGGSASVCYAMKLDSLSYFGIGASAGYYSVGLASNARFSDKVNDATAAAANGGSGFPDFNAGVYFRRKGLWAGFSTPQIIQRDLNFTNPQAKQGSTLKRHYMLMLGYEIPLSAKVKLEPSGMLRLVENAPTSFDLALKATFNNALWVAAQYRHQDAIAAMLGMTTKSGFQFYYAYDMTVSALSARSNGTHEFGLGINVCKKNRNDKDGDGVPNELDKCPDEKGTKENDGCPGDKADGEDTDGDGVPDSKDKCPEIKGTKENKGCPDKQDSDGDGVPDTEDQCPNFAGTKANKGCPFADRDNDGLRDDIDKCPDIAGTAKNEGCPLNDRDRDGIIDETDPCPDEYGTLQNMGCPPDKIPNSDNFANERLPNGAKRFPNARPGDRDGDGIPDAQDKCPNTPGDGVGGCPVVPRAGQDALDFALRNLYFDTDKAEIKIVSNTYLDGLVNWMKEHPEYTLKMQGHTDSRNTYEYNIELSKNRVYSVLYYLQDRGVAPSRVKVEWFGETRPIATNMNEQGRKQNRRVDMQWDFE